MELVLALASGAARLVYSMAVAMRRDWRRIVELDGVDVDCGDCVDDVDRLV